ncbi:MAG: hypothetical protein GWN67_06945 [Phycisphaerae bacterium]|nr:hypothetical protein [Phycisphaerae bacterium]NIR64065.1 hypothetical protein [candidate division Zixibacteria bacterium]NIP51706.1 hypothetical protein [Phycisphaerae bacterium]NIS50866.1 hypothetical protein [Phycisphaerae bacterium]NIU09563.1 hypothetical protein [Phycisphaerae bacterium]
MNSDKNITTVEFSPTGEQGKQAIKLAKKAIESLRNYISLNNSTSACRKCGMKHPIFHSCGGVEKAEKSKELTKRVLELFCGNIFRETMQQSEPSNMNYKPLYPCSAETTQKTETPVATTNKSEEKGQSEAKSTESHSVSTRTSTCQCCGNEGVPATHLYKIDSRQLLCPDCLKSLRKAASGITV